jgi:hypothetical protein
MDRFRRLIGFCIGFVSIAGMSLTVNATVIYSGLGTNGGWALPPVAGELGNEITVAGTDRVVTELEVGIFSQNGIFPNGTPGSVVFTAELYANDGAGGQPGSLLWQSADVGVDYPGGCSMVTFNVPQVVVPGTFTWTVDYVLTADTSPGLTTAPAPTIGSYIVGWFRGQNSEWGQATADLTAQIEAIPEPSTEGLVLVGLSALWLGHRLKKRGSPSWFGKIVG